MEFRKIILPFSFNKPVLALGSQVKNTVCLVKGSHAYISQTHQDLNNPKDFSAFEKDVKYLLRQRPKIIAYDLHPGYQSSRYIEHLPPNTCRLTPTQHHHAHIASCMADNGLKNQKVIGVAFDGTGLGEDNSLWGAEFMICDYKDFSRKIHLKEIPLIGGEAAIREPWRLLEAWCSFKRAPAGRLLKKIYLSGVNSPLASSIGRLFDAAASLILSKPKADFEAELAIELEKTAQEFISLSAHCYKFKITKNHGEHIIDPAAIFRQIDSALRKKTPRSKIAYQFHLTVAQMIRMSCLILRKETKINKVCFSGGVFQNTLLLKLSLDLLYKEGFMVFMHKQLPANDSGISLGEAMIANFRS